MNAAEVRARLAGRWPDHRYLSVYEAPTDSSRQGSKIDVLVLSLWQSDRHQDAQVCDRCVRAVEPPEPVLDTTSEPVVQTWT